MMSRYWVFGIIIGLILICGVIVYATGGKNMGLFIDPPGFMLVFGGTIAAALVAWPPATLKQNFIVTRFVLKKQVEPSQNVALEIIKLVDETNCDIREIEKAKPTLKNMFLRDALDLIIDRVEPHHIESILKERIKQNKKDYDVVVIVIKTIAKYPPAFGMIGTIIGLVALLSGIGSTIGISNLGPAMAVGLMTTFYGVVTSNLFLMPMADNVAYKSSKELLNRQIVLEGTKLIIEGTSPMIVQERLNSLLKFSERVDVYSTKPGDSKAGKAA